ncbi:ORF4 peptide [Hyphantria cunea nucleopolyhedrovirus]|uniref:ORF4 peptide n=2 Tax=Alphabaculovirus TaxID=558016 RepID=Q2NNU3_NPVHC|nr:ORF4 peptide [Hyphantria cunea nucleopolyhedrovirus]QNN89296.1 ORF4 [Spilarctia obliqua nucleopolyhedrovirus]BAE72293.1 ORF4 peptide [Hyphantria cunea nucleopolyhedrovirus]
MGDVNKNLLLEHNAFIVHPVTALTPDDNYFDTSGNVATPDKCLNVKAHTEFVLNSATCDNVAAAENNQPAETLSNQCNIQI